LSTNVDEHINNLIEDKIKGRVYHLENRILIAERENKGLREELTELKRLLQNNAMKNTSDTLFDDYSDYKTKPSCRVESSTNNRGVDNN
jgi:hypothetical protein